MAPRLFVIEFDSWHPTFAVVVVDFVFDDCHLTEDCFGAQCFKHSLNRLPDSGSVPFRLGFLVVRIWGASDRLFGSACSSDRSYALVPAFGAGSSYSDSVRRVSWED